MNLIDVDQYSVHRHDDPDDPSRAADIVMEMTTLPSDGLTINLNCRVQSVAWAGTGEASFSDIQWLDEIRDVLMEKMP